jgi:hypothetical protein
LGSTTKDGDPLRGTHGLPLGIHSDNGVSFASANSLFNLSRLSVWWLRLGIQIEPPATP